MRDDINNASLALSTQKNSRATSTDERVKAHNAAYARLRRVNWLAGLVFAEDWATHRQFVFGTGRRARRKKKGGGEDRQPQG